MSNVWLVLGVLACPLGMAAMGGVAWLVARFRRDRTPTVPQRSGMLGCNPLGALSKSGDRQAR